MRSASLTKSPRKSRKVLVAPLPPMSEAGAPSRSAHPELPAAELPDPCPAAEQAWRRRMIEEAAYYRYLHRGGQPGRELEDWVAAEHEVDAFLFMPCG
ncbi:MAG TPA: DUF2934 domain-containing protein [Steroidobacteraceae bacterium]|nr:DUF2934 domain-containing protein [Steroidobacteraceae bacterium]